MSDHEVAQPHETFVDRRTVMTSIGGAAVLFAGCTSGSQSGSGDDISSPDSIPDQAAADNAAFRDVRFNGRELEVAVGESANVAKLNAIRDGSAVGSTRIPTGASTATVFSASETLREEAIELVALDDEGNTVGSTRKTFSASMSPTRVRSLATKKGREPSKTAVDEYFREFLTGIVKIRNDGTAPLFIPAWKQPFSTAATVFLRDGVPSPAVPSDTERKATEPEKILIPPGEARDVPTFPGYFEPFNFNAPGKTPNEDWLAQIREMGEFPEGYADGDTLDVDVLVEDDQGIRISETIATTYSAGLFEFETGAYVPGRVDSGPTQ